MTRTGKIARLPHAIREELNRRLRDGEPGKTLVRWLNALPEIHTILQADFAGQPVTPQNLSEWKRGGYKDWFLQQEALAMIQTITADTDALQAASPDPLTDKLALWLVARYAIAAKSLKGTTDWPRLRELCFDLVLLRKGDHSAARLKLERERLAVEQEQLRELREEELWNWAREHRDEICKGYKTTAEKIALMRRALFGDVDPTEVRLPDCGCPPASAPTESDSIQPNPTSETRHELPSS